MLAWQMCISPTCGSVHTEVTFYETTLQSVTWKIKFCGVPEEESMNKLTSVFPP